MTFEDLGLRAEILSAVTEKGYETPTPIQQRAIPEILKGRDVIGSAQTGTGKTAAFALPVLSLLGEHRPGPRCLVLVPTRELAVQVDENFRLYGKNLDLNWALLYGGVKYGRQLEELGKKPDIVVATPGRLMDHYMQKNISFEGIEMLVLDEVDRMLDMGFIEDVRRIVRLLPKKRQTLFFSATVPDTIRKLAEWALHEPAEIDAGGRGSPAETVDHAIYPVDGIQKYDLLISLLEKMDYDSVLVFTRTKRDADRIADWLEKHDHPVATMHADRSQRERTEALQGFKEGRYKVLVATDIASRGLDISGITHVINYNVPEHPEDYVHRIGRTGRAAREGEAFTLFSSEESTYLGAIEKLIGKPIERRKLDDFPYRREPDLNSVQPLKPKRRNRGFSRPGEPSRFGKR